MTEYLDGLKLVGWLEGHGHKLDETSLGFHRRYIHSWRRGEAAELYKADAVMTKLDLHVDQLPEDFWVEAPR